LKIEQEECTEMGMAEQSIKNGLNWGWLHARHKEWTEMGLTKLSHHIALVMSF
jgi:hypothetical protein